MWRLQPSVRLCVKYAGLYKWRRDSCECSSSLSVQSSMSLSSSLFLSPLICPPFALLYIVLAISRSTNGSYSSISGGDPGPLGDGELKRSECRNAFYLFLSLFSSVSLMFPFPRSLFLSLPLPPLSLSPSHSVCVSGDSSESWLRAERSASLCL